MAHHPDTPCPNCARPMRSDFEVERVTWEVAIECGACGFRGPRAVTVEGAYDALDALLRKLSAPPIVRMIAPDRPVRRLSALRRLALKVLGA